MYVTILLSILFIFFSLCIAILDIRTGAIPRLALWGALVFSVGIRFFAGERVLFFEAIIGGGVGLAIFFLAFLFSGKKLGLADVWYAGLIGTVVGPVWWFPAILISCIAGSLYFAVKRSETIPFIPFMAAGSGIILPFIWQFGPGSIVW